MGMKHIINVRWCLVALLAGILLTACDLGNEFATSPAKRLIQTTRSIDDIVSGLPWYLEPRALSLKAFRIGNTPYLAMKVNVGMSWKLIILDKDLKTQRTFNEADLPGWIPNSPYWHIDGSVDSRYGSPYVALSGGDASNWINGFCYFISSNNTATTYMFYTADTFSNAPWLAMRGPGNFITVEGSIPSHYNGALNTPVPPIPPGALDAPSLADNFAYNGMGPISGTTNAANMGSFKPNTFLMDFKAKGTNAVAYVVAPGLYSSMYNWGMSQPFADFPLYYLNTSAGDIVDSGTTLNNISSYRIMDLAWDPEKDGQIYSLGDYIMDIRASNYGFIVPYPTGRDRLVDFETGKTKFTFELEGNSNDDHDTKSRNKPRAYLNGADFWFLYDSESREIQRLKGWWE